MRRIGILFGVFVLTAAACGSSGGSTGAKPSSTTKATNPITDRDARLGRAGLVRPADVPGFTAGPHSTKAELDAIEARQRTIPECATFAAARRDGERQQRSPRFKRQQVASVDSSTDIYPDTSAIAAQLELYRNPTIIDCLRVLYTALIAERLGTTATVDQLDVSPIAVENVGDGQFGFRVSVTISKSGKSQTILSDIVGVQVGRVGLSLNVGGSQAEMAELESRLVPLLVDRLQRAGA